MKARVFRCMTTDISILLANDDLRAEPALAQAEAFFHSVESRFSRFLAGSELSLLNAAGPGLAVPVSPDLAELVSMALDAARLSGGVFDPTILDALEAAGYDRSIEEVRSGGTVVRSPAAAAGPGGWMLVEVRRLAGVSSVCLAAGRRIDLGGIAKGWAADRAGEMLLPLGPGIVDAGGDIRAWGDQPGAVPGHGWLVAVDDPRHPGADAIWLHVHDGAVATSSVVTRRWAGGHHLIDPRTGRPADTDLLSVTALAPTTAQAEVAAKVVLILGRAAGQAWLAAQAGVDALLAGSNGDFYGTPGLGTYYA